MTHTFASNLELQKTDHDYNELWWPISTCCMCCKIGLISVWNENHFNWQDKHKLKRPLWEWFWSFNSYTFLEASIRQFRMRIVDLVLPLIRKAKKKSKYRVHVDFFPSPYENSRIFVTQHSKLKWQPNTSRII